MIAIVDYGMGNTGSVVRMLRKIGCDASIADHPKQLRSASKLIVPGVGAFDNAIEKLATQGFREELDDLVMNAKIPVLGICLGMQLLFEKSEEGQLPGLGWVKGEVKRFHFQHLTNQLVIPHMGWTNVESVPTARLFGEDDSAPRFYFVHSFHAVPLDSNVIAATADYGYRFCCAVEQGNVFGVQFHPEKSHKFGLRLLKRFAAL